MALETSMETIDNLIRKLQNLKPQTQEYLDDNMQSLYEKHVIPEVKSIAMAMNLPRKFIDGIKFVKTGKNEGKVINTWGTPNKPLARWFNYGTKAHFIAPIGALSLHWITKEGRDAYSKGHMVSGLPKTNAMEIGIEQGMNRLKVSTQKDTSDFLIDEANK